MEHSTKKMLPALSQNTQRSKPLAVTTVSSTLKSAATIVMPLASSFAISYFGAPYVTIVSRETYPYAYGVITGSTPAELSTLHYYGSYVPMREHVANLAYQHSYLICMTASLAGFYSAKKACALASAACRSIYAFFVGEEALPAATNDSSAQYASPG